MISNRIAAVTTTTQPWMRSLLWDLLFIIGPAFITSAVALCFKDQLENMKTLPLWAWVSFVLLVDVAHVYATLFRTYFDKEALAKNSTLLWIVPIACWAVGTLLYSMNGLVFWRVLAYLAVFHFIRQQYGLMSFYARKDPPDTQRFKPLDAACIYLATLYPLLYWHTNMPRNFSWFLEGDFIDFLPSVAADVGLIAYLVVAALYLLKEAILLRTTGFLNIPKNLLLIGTAFSWWVAIVAINSDFSFTMVNVISHGVPYMALIWFYHGAKSGRIHAIDINACGTSNQYNTFDFIVRAALSYAPAFFLFLCFLAYMEEGLWAGFVWREHFAVFTPFAHLPIITDHSLLAILVPLLSLPQSTHYVLDGFIWRMKDRKSIWSV